METFSVLTASEQVAKHLRGEITNGRWTEAMPGGDRLARQLGIGRNTIEAAFLQLENEGILRRSGRGKRRLILGHEESKLRNLRVLVLANSSEDKTDRLTNSIFQEIEIAGHRVKIADRCLADFKFDPERVLTYAKKNNPDALVTLAASQEILEALARDKIPTFAFAGRLRGLPIAGVKPDKMQAQETAVERLYAFGHRRIVKLVTRDRVSPSPGASEQAFLEKLHALGLPTSSYNLTVYDSGRSNFHQCLETLFRFTPPTALFFDSPMTFFAGQNYLAQRGFLAPKNVSLICNDPDPYFSMMSPEITHIDWNLDQFTRPMIRWLKAVVAGKDDRRQAFIQAKFIEGGTIGPAAKIRPLRS